MYYSAGTYESFAHPEKPKDVDKKSAYIIGTGLAGLTAALQQAFTPASALSFLVFVLLYMPCVAAFSAIRREMNSWKD